MCVVCAVVDVSLEYRRHSLKRHHFVFIPFFPKVGTTSLSTNIGDGLPRARSTPQLFGAEDTIDLDVCGVAGHFLCEDIDLSAVRFAPTF